MPQCVGRLGAQSGHRDFSLRARAAQKSLYLFYPLRCEAAAVAAIRSRHSEDL